MKRLGILGGQFLGAIDCSWHALGVRGAGDLGAQGPHDHDFFLRKMLGDKQRDLVAAIHPNQRQPDPGVPGGGFDDGASRPERPCSSARANNSDGGAVFHASARDSDTPAWRRRRPTRRHNPFQLQDGSFADQLSDVVSDSQARTFNRFSALYRVRKRAGVNRSKLSRQLSASVRSRTEREAQLTASLVTAPDSMLLAGIVPLRVRTVSLPYPLARASTRMVRYPPTLLGVVGL